MFASTAADQGRLSPKQGGNLPVVVLAAGRLNKAFGGNSVLRDINLELRAGDVVLLRGDNGSGKTTLLNILTGNLEPDSGWIRMNAAGSEELFEFPLRWRQRIDPFERFMPERIARESVGRTWQDVRLFSTRTLVDNIAVSRPGQPGERPMAALLGLRGAGPAEARNRAESASILDRLGLKGRENSSADKISLGQAKRVAIARAVRSGSRVLFLDEPLSGLDGEGIEGVMSYLEELAHGGKSTLVIIEHVLNIPRILAFARTVWTLADGSLSVENPTTVQKELKNLTVPADRPAWLRELDLPGLEVRNEILPAGATLTRIRRPGIPITTNQPALELKSLVVCRGRRVVIGGRGAGSPDGFDLRIMEGEIAVLQAPNGWGKSSLIRAISGQLPAQSGTVSLHGERIDGLPPWRRVRKGLAILPSDDFAFPSLKVGEVFRLAGRKGAEVAGESLRDRFVSCLSGGESRAVAVRTLRPEGFGLFDEPFGALDQKMSRELLRHLILGRSTALLTEPLRRMEDA